MNYCTNQFIQFKQKEKNIIAEKNLQNVINLLHYKGKASLS